MFIRTCLYCSSGCSHQTQSYRGPLLNATESYLLVLLLWLYSTNGHSESRCCMWCSALRTLLHHWNISGTIYICKTMFISDIKSSLTSKPRASKVITFIWPNHRSMIQRGNTHNLFMLGSVTKAIEMKRPYVWVSSLWIPHGDGARQGRIYPWKQMGRKRGREPSSWESLLGVSLWQNELQTSGEAYCQKAAHYLWLIIYIWQEWLKF